MAYRQQAFCENLVSGMNQSAAYRRAYPTSRSEAAVWVNASPLLIHAKVRQKMGVLQKLAQTEKALLWKAKREILAGIAGDHCNTPMEIMAAIKVDNQMAGHDMPPRDEANSGYRLIEFICGLPEDRPGRSWNSYF